MRRVVTALALIAAAVAIAACSSAPSSTSTPPASSGQAPAVTPPAATAQTAGTDVLSPRSPIAVGTMLPTDPATVPSAILSQLQAHKPMLIFFYDPTTSVATDERTEINTAIKKYAGTIVLEAIDYTPGIPSTESSTSQDPEVAKGELLAAAVGVKMTPTVVFVDANGRVTYSFQGFVDSGLLEREVLRATE